MNAPVHLDAHYRASHYRIRPPVLLLVRDERIPEGAPSSARNAGWGTSPDPETISDWCQVHERMVGLGAERAAHERELCRWLRAAERLGVHARTGHGSLHEYAERILGLGARQVEERLRVAHALARLPLLDQALGSGTLSWSAVRELTRIARPATERAWLGWAKGRRSRQIEQAVAARRPGDRPQDRPDPSLAKYRLRFDVRAETMALWRDIQARLRTELGAAMDDDTLLYELARRALGGPTDEGRASYQIVVSRCPDCGLASVDAGGQNHLVGRAVAEMAACDGQNVGSVEVGGVTRPCPHVGAAAAGATAPKSRATQSIPPATRRQVMLRDHKRCVVPGCRNHQFLDVHHLEPRSEGGRHEPDRLSVLCGPHHRAVHMGTLVIGGSARSGLTFRHADGSPYGLALVPSTLDIAQQAFGALRRLGFAQTRARALIDAVLREGAPEELAAFLRTALSIA